MARWCLLVLASACVLTAHAFPAGTDETMVVTKQESDTTETLPESEAITTEGPAPPVKLQEMNVHSEVSLRYAHTAVVTRVRNPANKAQETTFHVLLPDTAFISGFTMTLDGKSYKAYVKEKEEAKQIYNQAVSQGLGTALISAKARDSNHFTVSVNVEPNTEAVFNLTYEELLERRNGVYNHAINLHPGSLVPKLTVTVHIKEGQIIKSLRVPEVRTGNEIDANDADAQNTKAKIVKSDNEREATVTFSPDLEEQKRLMDVYTEKTRESRRQENEGFYYRPVEQDHSQEEGVLGQFVVQYDVDHSKKGEILVNDGYFVHFFAPTSLPPLPKHVVFVLDTSGSMGGRKIEQLREAMRSILSDLNSGDYFNIVEFHSFVNVHDLSEADTPEPETSNRYAFYGYERSQPVTLKAPSLVTPLNIEKAKTIVGRLNASGGTNIYDALSTAIDIVNKGTDPRAYDSPTTAAVTTVTDATTVAVPASSAEPSESVDDSPRPEPIIIFLTDGDPTVGESNPQRIINHISEKNFGDNKATIFSLAFGEDADRGFLRKLSLRNEGFMRHIYEAADAALQLRDFYRQVSSPLLSNVRFIYAPEQVKQDSLTRHKFRTFYLGSEAVVAGQLVTDQPIDFEPTIEGTRLTEDSKKRKTYREKPKITVSAEPLPLERLWAYLTIKQLLDERDANDSIKDDDENSPKKRALIIALKYAFVTPLTSLVVVKPNATSAVDAESVDKPGLPLPSYAFASSPGFSGASLNVGGGFPIAAARPAAAQAYPQSFAFAQSHNSYMPMRASVSAIDMSSFAHRSYLPMDMISTAHLSNINYMPSSLSAFDMGSHLPFDTLTQESTDVSRIALATAVDEPIPTYEAATTPSPLATYRLESLSWTETLIDAARDALVLQLSNGTEVVLNLAKDSKDEPTGPGADCEHSVLGGVGVCTYLTQCPAATNVQADSYVTMLHCSRDGYAGVCCPKSEQPAPEPTGSATVAVH